MDKKEEMIISKKLYYLAVIISFIYVTIFIIFISYFFNKKIDNEMNFKLKSKSLYLNQSNSTIMYNNLISNRFKIKSLLNTGSKKELKNLMKYYVDPFYYKNIFNQLNKFLFKDGLNLDNLDFITFDKIQGNIITIKNKKIITYSSYIGTVEKNRVLTFKTNQNTLKDSKFYNIYVIFNTNNKINKITITKNNNLLMIIKNKQIIYYIINDPKKIYNYLNEPMLNSFIISKLRTEKIKSIKLIGNSFKNDNLISLIYINNIKYKLILHDKRIIKIEKL